MTIALRPASSTTSAIPEVLRRYRLAISLMFLIAGMTIGTWTARIPTIQHNIKMADGKLSICLLLLAAGGLVGMRAAGRLIDRHGSTTVMVLPSLGLGGALLLAGHAPTWTTLAAALLAFGILHGTLNVAMNAAAVSCQSAYGRPIMTSFHALFSIGGVAGALLSAACAHLGLSVADAFAAAAVMSTAAAGWSIHRLIPAPVSTPSDQGSDSTAAADPVQRRPRTRILLLGLLAFSALISEGAAADWASTYLTRLGATPAMAATAYAAFAASMTLGRLVGDRLTAAVAPAALLRGCGLIGGGGLALGLLGGTPVTAIAGFACLGAGLSCVVPLLYSTAGSLDPARPGAALSRVAALGYLGYVTGPAIIGGAAVHIGLGNALFILPVLATLLVVVAPVVHRSRGRHHRTGTLRGHKAPVPAVGDDMTPPDRLTRTSESTTDHIDHQVLELEGALR
ncbi:MFS transporter [Paractinoplanes ferrugineus]|uniref:MFS transporter n=1 Tax=Paractinoplanes ferrugineus TaxID=113564 RepID=A0A919J652_9ACTN|nr:MFS transporter [Actinoplanes ferrugineus]GIE15190.1 MFS transporter [Actinoplanes ferrugineus]